MTEVVDITWLEESVVSTGANLGKVGLLVISDQGKRAEEYSSLSDVLSVYSENSVEYQVSSRLFLNDSKVSAVKILKVRRNETVVEAFQEILKEASDFYFMLAPELSQEDRINLLVYISSQSSPKYFVYSTGEIVPEDVSEETSMTQLSSYSMNKAGVCSCVWNQKAGLSFPVEGEILDGTATFTTIGKKQEQNVVIHSVKGGVVYGIGVMGYSTMASYTTNSVTKSLLFEFSIDDVSEGDEFSLTLSGYGSVSYVVSEGDTLDSVSVALVDLINGDVTISGEVTATKSTGFSRFTIDGNNIGENFSISSSENLSTTILREFDDTPDTESTIRDALISAWNDESYLSAVGTASVGLLDGDVLITAVVEGEGIELDIAESSEEYIDVRMIKKGSHQLPTLLESDDFIWLSGILVDGVEVSDFSQSKQVTVIDEFSFSVSVNVSGNLEGEVMAYSYTFPETELIRKYLDYDPGVFDLYMKKPDFIESSSEILSTAQLNYLKHHKVTYCIDYKSFSGSTVRFIGGDSLYGTPINQCFVKADIDIAFRESIVDLIGGNTLSADRVGISLLRSALTAILEERRGTGALLELTSRPGKYYDIKMPDAFSLTDVPQQDIKNHILRNTKVSDLRLVTAIRSFEIEATTTV